MTTTASAPFRASRYTTGAIVLHWAIAFLILAQLVGGYVMSDVLPSGSSDQYVVFQLHKSFGILVLLLTIARILWRIFNPPPPVPASVSRLEDIASRIVHFGFYALLLIVPLAGWLTITVAPVHIETVLFFVEGLPWPNLPFLGSLGEATRDTVYEAAGEVHGFLAYTIVALLVLHIAGAVKHHLADGHFVLRMVPLGSGDGPRRTHGRLATIVVTLTVFVLLVGSAWIARNMAPSASSQRAASAAAPLTSGAAAEAPVADAPATPEGPAPLWTIVPDESLIRYAFRYEKDTVTGTLPALEAEIRFDEANLPGSSISASIDLSSVTVASGGLTVAQIRGTNGLAASKDGFARFESDSLTHGADGGFVASGRLTVRGVTQEIDLPFTLAQENDRVVADGTVALDRKAFGFGDGAGLSDETIAASVEVSVEIVAIPPDGMPLAR